MIEEQFGKIYDSSESEEIRKKLILVYQKMMDKLEAGRIPYISKFQCVYDKENEYKGKIDDVIKTIIETGEVVLPDLFLFSTDDPKEGIKKPIILKFFNNERDILGQMDNVSHEMLGDYYSGFLVRLRSLNG